MPEFTEKTQEQVDADAKAKAEAQGQAIVDKFETQEGLAYLQENMNKAPDDPTYDATAAALTLFGLYGPKLWQCVDQLSNKQLRRLLKCLVTYPLEDIEINKKNKFEVEAFRIADRLITSKYLVVMGNAFEEEQKRAIAAEEYKKAEELQKVSSNMDELNKPNGENNG